MWEQTFTTQNLDGTNEEILKSQKTTTKDPMLKQEIANEEEKNDTFQSAASHLDPITSGPAVTPEPASTSPFGGGGSSAFPGFGGANFSGFGNNDSEDNDLPF